MKYKNLHKIFFFILCFIIQSNIKAQTEQPNFIFIVVDDLNDYIEGYTDQPQIVTPNIKQIAAEGTTFLNSYSSAAGCAPSRTSFFSGKDLYYTKVYNNEDYDSKFRDNFTAADNNQVVYTLPQILKDSAGYFTYGINKLFHNPSENDYDKTVGTPQCDKSLSWNKMIFTSDSDSLLEVFSQYAFGNYFDWGMIPDSMEDLMEDYKGADSAIAFIDAYANGTTNTCGNPFFLGLGFFRPHSERYIPEKYFPPYYLKNIYDEPFVLPYNNPIGTFPYNGFVMPPQPDTIWQDYYNLPTGGIAQTFADGGKVYDNILNYIDELSSLPIIDPDITDAQREAILFQAVNADYAINYFASVQFLDAQVGRVMDALNAHPDLKANTIIILISDNGYSLGEKRHWTKWTLWEPDIRVPFIVVDPSIAGGQMSDAPASILDIFPTICDKLGLDYPLFPDGKNYLDGHSLMPVLEQPQIQVEWPTLTSYKKNGSVGGCHPHYSIRTDRFHYIRYQKNNDGTGTFAPNYCDTNYVGFEEELYEVGTKRETDPFEWNNLISNADYYPVIHYLQQWIPDSSMYLQKAFKPIIQSAFSDCIAEQNAVLEMHFDLYDTAGILITLPENYICKWSNNLTDEIHFEESFTFNFNTISDYDFNANDRIMFYLEIIDTINNITKGLDLKYIYINVDNIPYSTFTLVNAVKLEVSIQNYHITGSYASTWWDFGDGHTSDQLIPGNYTYADTGTYTITNYVEYGNDSCISITQKSIHLTETPNPPEPEITFFPNPANNLLQVNFSLPLNYAVISIYDLTGRRINEIQYLESTHNFLTTIDVSNFVPAMYVLLLQSGEQQYVGRFIVNH